MIIDTLVSFVSCKEALEIHDDYESAKQAILKFQEEISEKSEWSREELQALPNWKLQIVTGTFRRRGER